MATFLATWEEVVPVDKPFIRKHVRILEGDTSLKAWNEMVIRENLKPMRIDRVRVRSWDDHMLVAGTRTEYHEANHAL